MHSARRNDFVHGNAFAIGKPPVRETVERLHRGASGGRALFNLRCAGAPQCGGSGSEKVLGDKAHLNFRSACAIASG
jgi:hypothetical protein